MSNSSSRLVTTSGSLCDTLMSSTCHNTMHYLLLIILFATHHQSYGLISNPHSFTFLVSFFQNSSPACRVPYKAFFSCTYSTDLPIFTSKYFRYNLGSIFTSSKGIVHYALHVSLHEGSRYVCSGNIVSLFCVDVHDNITDLMATGVGELVSSFDMHSLCFLPSVHPYPFIFPQHFCF
jgi:hypothetical protein